MASVTFRSIGPVAIIALIAVVAVDPNPQHWFAANRMIGAAEAGPGRGVGAGARGVGVAPIPGAGGVGAPGAAVARRNIVATGAYVARLPAGCATVQVGGAPLYSCGGKYYQASGGKYAVVTVQ